MKWIECPECEGEGWVEVDDPRPHAGGFNCGYIDSKWVPCEYCGACGEIEIEDETDEE